MSRIVSDPDDTTAPRIDPEAVRDFFEERARKIEELGSVRAIIYQDKHPDLAERRDAAEKSRIAPLLRLDGSQRILDVGCGTGRWAAEVAGACRAYHGVDASAGLIEFAREQFFAQSHCRFTVLSATAVSLTALAEPEPFDRILCAGLLVYLNDDELALAFDAFGSVAAPECLILLREPMGIRQRLTLQDHYSEELEQRYNAIYRSEAELVQAATERLSPLGFEITGSGDVYDDSLNNRVETKQRWISLERRA